MSFKIVGKVLPKFFLDELEKTIAANIASALREDFSTVKATAKAVALHVDIKTDTVKKWYNGSNKPSAAHLIILARASPSVHQALMNLIDGKP